MNLNTERLNLRPFTANDVTDTYVHWLNDKDVTRISNQRFQKHTLETCLNYVQSFYNTKNTFLLLSNRVNKVPIGTMTIYRSNWHGTADIGLMLGNRQYWGNKFGLEAWSAVLEALLKEDGIRKVTGGTASPNIAMVKIMQQSKMNLEAVRKRHEIIENEPTDLLYYARFADKLA